MTDHLAHVCLSVIVRKSKASAGPHTLLSKISKRLGNVAATWKCKQVLGWCCLGSMHCPVATCPNAIRRSVHEA